MNKIVFWKYENQCYLRSQFPPIFEWKQRIKHVLIILAFSFTWDSNLRMFIRLQSSLFPNPVEDNSLRHTRFSTFSLDFQWFVGIWICIFGRIQWSFTNVSFDLVLCLRNLDRVKRLLQCKFLINNIVYCMTFYSHILYTIYHSIINYKYIYYNKNIIYVYNI